MNRIEEIKKIALENSKKYDELSKLFFRFHVKPVVKYSLDMARKFGANKEVVEIAAWLHDNTIESHGNEDHHITGAMEAERIMRKMGYPEDMIKKVSNAIISHRCRDGYLPKSLEAKILATADALGHIDGFLILPWIAKRNDIGLKETFEWISEKIDRDLEKKIFFPEIKKTIRNKVQTYKILLNHTIKLLEND